MTGLDSEIKAFLFYVGFMLLPAVLAATDTKKEVISMEVMATAYNSLPEQTDENPFEAAWGDILTPEVKSIAVSRDLLEMGLTQYSVVEIEGLPGKYVVLDKMNSRWEKKIDIYMGTDLQEALKWGIKKVTIRWIANHH